MFRQTLTPCEQSMLDEDAWAEAREEYLSRLQDDDYVGCDPDDPRTTVGEHHGTLCND